MVRVCGRRGAVVIQIGVDFGGTKVEAAALDAAGQERWRAPARGNPGCLRRGHRPDRRPGGAGWSRRGRPARHGAGRRRAAARSRPRPAPSAQRQLTAVPERPATAPARTSYRGPGAASVRLANDANCLALSEAVDGAAAGAGVACAVILGLPAAAAAGHGASGRSSASLVEA
ncbi:hypothetical protein ACRAWD_03550 [Caulobacter segnis]